MRPLAEKVVQRLQQAGYQAHYVGGAVRDRLLRRPVQDIDVATNASPHIVARLFRYTKATGKNFKVTLVSEGSEHVEVATWRQDIGIGDGRHPRAVRPATLAEDARRRDFTINAIYYDPLTRRYCDPVSGRRDLRQKIVRFVGDPDYRILEDHLRLLRAIRFKNHLGGKYAPTTWQAIIRHSALITKLPHERLRTELDKMILGYHPTAAWSDLEKSGLLTALGWKKVVRMPVYHRRLSNVTTWWGIMYYRLPTAYQPILLEWLQTMGYGTKTRHHIMELGHHLKLGSAPRRPGRDWILFRHPLWPKIHEALGWLNPKLARSLQRRYHRVNGYQNWPELLTGQDLWLAGFRGPEIATWLTKAREAQLGGQFHNHTQARAWLNKKAPVRRL